DIVNAYDNSIGYTDHFLNQAILMVNRLAKKACICMGCRMQSRPTTCRW
ncbi:hypothetical protein XGA_2622, partial [Xanthomonas hortorum ATCC 19865]